MPPRPSGKGKGPGKGMARPCCDRFYQLRDFFIQTINQGTFTQIQITLDRVTTPTKVPAGQIQPIQLGQATGETVFVNSINWFNEQNCTILLDALSDQFSVPDRFIDCQTLTTTFAGVQQGPG
jgi:hypothetical protein